MSVLPTGAALSQQITFNSGTFDINGFELATLQDITVTMNWSTKEIYQLGSLIMATAPKRHSFKPSAKAKLKSMHGELFQFFMGSSNTDGSGFDYTVFDGQNVLTRCSIKCIMNEDPTKVVEFQFTNAILSGNLAAAFKAEDVGEVDFEIMAQNVTVVRNF